MLNFWNGHKSKILSALTVLVTIAYTMKWIETELYLALLGLLGGSSVATLRHGMATEAAKVLAKVEHVETKVENVAPTVARETEHIVQTATLPGGRHTR